MHMHVHMHMHMHMHMPCHAMRTGTLIRGVVQLNHQLLMGPNNQGKHASMVRSHLHGPSVEGSGRG